MKNESRAVFFDPKSLGKSLHEIAVDVIQTETQNVTSHWFHSNKDVDVFIWFDERKNIIKQQVSIFGQLTEWNIIDGVKTGSIIEIETKPAQNLKKISGSELIQFDSQTQKEALNQAMELLHHAEAIEQSLRDKILKNFICSPHIGNMDPVDFLRRYDTKVKDTKKPFFWHRILALFYRK